jgi:CrcB protein
MCRARPGAASPLPFVYTAGVAKLARRDGLKIRWGQPHVGSIPTPGTVNPIGPFPSSAFLWVALGGAIGSALRYGVGESMRRIPALATFPWATLFINVLGSFVIGGFLRWSSDTDASPQVRAFVAIGLCGGFTTFSTFAAENLTLLQDGQLARAAAHAILSLALTVSAAFLGYSLIRV